MICSQALTGSTESQWPISTTPKHMLINGLGHSLQTAPNRESVPNKTGKFPARNVYVNPSPTVAANGVENYDETRKGSW